jgi:ribosome biogenesis GTPase / thiamine phosphate phosphatase
MPDPRDNTSSSTQRSTPPTAPVEGFRALGADVARLEEIDQALGDSPEGTLAGRVVRVDRGQFTLADGQTSMTVPTSGIAPVAVGDWCLAVPVPGVPSHLSLELWRVLARRTELVREAAGKRTELQALAANIDTVLVLTPLDRKFSARQIERFLSLAWESGADPVLVLTKGDLAQPDHIESVEAAAASVAVGLPVIVTSVVTGAGLTEVMAYLSPGRTLALLGTSGCGKSSMVNALMGADLARTGAVRAADAKGRHTTTWRELLVGPSGWCIIDTPGLRELGMWITDKGIDAAFSDVSDLERTCRFANCTHVNEPGCGVLEAVQAGDLDVKRLDSYRKLQREAAFTARKFDRRLASEERRIWKQRTREGRQRARPRER